MKDAPVAFVHVDSTEQEAEEAMDGVGGKAGFSKKNRTEARLVHSIVQTLLQAGDVGPKE